jgi:predicted nucleic acid-binding Zn ribbon protein
MSRGRRRSTPHTAAAGLESLLDDIAPEDTGDVGLARLPRAWPGAVGPAISAAGRPVAFVDGVLHVACEDATWAHELELLQRSLLGRLHAAGMTDVVAIRPRAGGAGGAPGGRGPAGGPRRSRGGRG